LRLEAGWVAVVGGRRHGDERREWRGSIRYKSQGEMMDMNDGRAEAMKWN
jgi:hypothetical protein